MATRGHRDYPTHIPAGGSVPVTAAGEFVYIKYSDRPLRVVIDGNPMIMERGDFSRFPQQFDSLVIENRDTVNPISAVLVVGFGEFDRKIVTGEITVTPGIRVADGTWLNDSRQEITLSASLTKTVPTTFAAGVIQYIDVPGIPASYGKRATMLSDGRIFTTENFYGHTGFVYNWLTGNPYAIMFDSYFKTGNALGNGYGGCAGVEAGNALLIPKKVLGDLVIHRHNKFTGKRLLRGDVTTGYALAGSEIKDAVYDQAQNRLWVLHNSAPSGNDQLTVVNLVDGTIAVDVTLESILGSIMKKVDGMCLDNQGFVRVVDQPAMRVALMNLADVSYVPGSYATTEPGTGVYGGLSLTPRGTILAGGTGYKFQEYSYENVEQTLTGRVSACAAAGIVRTEPGFTLADVEATQDETGRYLVTGEVIRAVLDMFKGAAPVRADYLDYIYRVTFSEESGLAPRSVDSGGLSFQAAEIVDQFTVPFPARLNITYRKGLFDDV